MADPNDKAETITEKATRWRRTACPIATARPSLDLASNDSLVLSQNRAISPGLASLVAEGKRHTVCLLRQSNLARVYDDTAVASCSPSLRGIELVRTQQM